MRFLSPLRYPGGKAALGPFLGSILERLPETVDTYVEPFAGGAGAALRLLVDEYVSRIVINDINVGIVEVWRNVFERTDKFVAMLQDTPVTVDEWHRQRAVYDDDGAPGLDRGFATFFLNRTNRSGILGARPIGGLDQTGPWKIDARYHVDELADRIRFISGYRNRVDVRHADAHDLLRAEASKAKRMIVYADPPYLVKSHQLYIDACDWTTHVAVARTLRADYPFWVVTYDEDDRVMSDLYPRQRAARFSLSHTAGKQRVGSEVAVFSKRIAALAEVASLGPHGGSWYDGSSMTAS